MCLTHQPTPGQSTVRNFVCKRIMKLTCIGLWPDNCNGGYQENCDKTREYKDITTLLTNAGLSDTLDYMNTVCPNDAAHRASADGSGHSIGSATTRRTKSSGR